MQPTPSVSDDDVIRVVRRDYPSEDHDAIFRQIAAIEVREKPRVILACLKVAGGDTARLQKELKAASAYWREIISEAEYPMASKKWNKLRNGSDEDRQQVYDDDWQQYSAWLNRKSDTE